MKLTAHFNYFMTNTVNMDETRLRDLARSVQALYDTLVADDTFGPTIIDKHPQGSWAQATIIKPVDGREFDADFMLVMLHQPDWDPSDYLDNLAAAIKRSSYGKTHKVTRKNRCVRVHYAEYHVDIVPFTVLPDGRQVIAHSQTADDGMVVDEWEDTAPAAFTRWMQTRDGIASGHLRRTIRLMKYLRDHHMHFKRSRSVILTVILGERISAAKKTVDPGYYADLPTAFVHVLEDLDAWMDANPTLPPLDDPSGANNNFSHRWTQESYESLAKNVKTIAADARAAISDDLDVDESLEAWQKIFGPDFKRPPDTGGRGSSSGPGGAGSAAAAGVIASKISSRGG